MVLLSQMMRRAAFTGRTDNSMFTRIAGRQGGAWAERTVAAAYPEAQPPPARDPAEALREATALHDRGVLTDAEFQHLRGRLGA
jgi:hypothetical protein